MSVGIVDYGSGNLRSMQGAIEKLGFSSFISSDPEDLEKADKLVLPGVGAFGDCMANLHERGLVGGLDELVLKRRMPILGVCLGAQLMCLSSDEFGHHEGLGWIPAHVRKLEPQNSNFKVPHVGWNDVEWVRDSILMKGVDDTALFYFVHSYAIHAEDPGVETGRCHHGIGFTASFSHLNIHGTQFHPEKSQRGGLDLLYNFLERV